MLEQIESLMGQYWRWLRDRTSYREIGVWAEITTPYLDRHNDCLQIYAKNNDTGIVLTDDSYILDDLEQSGYQINSSKRRTLLNDTLNGFGVRRNDNALEVIASDSDFALKKHNLLQAMLAVNDLFYLASPVVASLFIEDVIEWLDSSDVRYTPNIKLTGSSGYDHVFDFIIPKSRAQPERVLKTINRPDKQAVQNMVFAWIDTKDARPLNSQAYAILNDSDKQVTAGVIEAMHNHDVHTIPWSVRHDSEPVLTS